MEIKIKDITTHRRRAPWDRGGSRRDYAKTTRVYLSIAEESVWDNLANRKRRPWQEYRRLMPQVLEALGMPADTKFRWDQRAGCNCPCSPGMVLDRQVRVDEDNNIVPTGHGFPADVWVTVVGEEYPADYDPADIAAQVMGGVLVTGLPR